MRTRFIVLMGVAGSGKTRVGRALAEQLGWEFYDADDFHPPENIAKMADGIALDDADRTPWLAALHDLIRSSLQAERPGVLACSALKERYRRQLVGGREEVRIVYLKGSYDLIRSRLEQRTDHYMQPSMLESQFEALEEPAAALVIDISMPVEDIVQVILEQIDQ